MNKQNEQRNSCVDRQQMQHSEATAILGHTLITVLKLGTIRSLAVIFKKNFIFFLSSLFCVPFVPSSDHAHLTKYT
eukprot:m.372726 g.372726  ORF g.372726 m.372726 type:complete len:76 (+) comp64149_c0_seq1:64-291(+)